MTRIKKIFSKFKEKIMKHSWRNYCKTLINKDLYFIFKIQKSSKHLEKIIENVEKIHKKLRIKNNIFRIYINSLLIQLESLSNQNKTLINDNNILKNEINNLLETINILKNQDKIEYGENIALKKCNNISESLHIISINLLKKYK
jgi:hypothetical protein